MITTINRFWIELRCAPQLHPESIYNQVVVPGVQHNNALPIIPTYPENIDQDMVIHAMGGHKSRALIERYLTHSKYIYILK